MKFGKLVVLLAIPALIAVSCDTRDTPSSPSVDREAPPVPTGVNTTTLDRTVIVSWNSIYLDPDYDDLDGFRIYRSLNNQDFVHIGTVGEDEHQYYDEGLQNGTTYYYAVTSFDYNGNESDLSHDSAYDTPRPEGVNYIYTLTDQNYLDESGFDFSTDTRLIWDHPECDFFLEYDADPEVRTYYLWLGPSGAFIQDMGYTDSFDDITYAPSQGWSAFEYVEAIYGHTYVIQTTDDHFAKVRVSNEFTSPTRGIEFEWGYQVAAGNRELNIGSPKTNHSGASTEVQ